MEDFGQSTTASLPMNKQRKDSPFYPKRKVLSDGIHTVPLNL